jgi:C4-dicarboxylate-specific signal transduction histidine kinase
VVEALRVDLMLLRSVLAQGESRADGASAASSATAAPPGARERVDVREALSRLRPSLERAVEPMVVAWSLGAQPLPAEIAGGEPALLRLVLNLLVNAQQGDGERGARHAEVRLSANETGAPRIAVQDDGPGFAAAGISPKRSGTGHGLPIVLSIARASGGSVESGDNTRGAWVTISLPPPASESPAAESKGSDSPRMA